ncbi:MAG: BamA/TamA family outer membrane protein [Acidobacteria bacterium]|jgi:outer membrane translocation and assembly module TamA|nr:BamA/TamA family outer membrane protein [Acidobacteriota bacterium]
MITFSICTAQDKTKDNEINPQTATAKKKIPDRIIGAPIIYYTPETHLAFGAAGSYISRLGRSIKDTRPTTISPIIIYTQKKQFKTQLNTDIYLRADDCRLQMEFKLEKFPNKFFGVGNNTLESDIEAYTSRSTAFTISFLKKVGSILNLGLKYNFSNWKMMEVEKDGLLDSGLFPGSKDGTISGFGLLVNFDTRDNIFSTLKGSLVELDIAFYQKALGSTFNFSSWSLDFRKYFTVFSTHVLAFQSLVKIQTGEVPFLNLAQMGGQYNMRGYFQGRFRDKNLMVLQAEYRLPVVWRFGLVGFAGVGNVAEKFSKLSLLDLKYSYGMGIRFLFDPLERIQARMDIGFGKGCSGFYFSIFEAF